MTRARTYVDPDDFQSIQEDGEFILQEDGEIQWPEPPDTAAYHGVLGNIALGLAPHTEADPIGILGTLLVQYGVACGDGASVHKGSQHRAKEQVILVGDTSTARKGTAWSVASEVMRAAYPGIDSLVWTGLGSGEGIPGKLEMNGKDAAAGGTTPEYRGLIYEGEFSRLLTSMSREGSTLSQQLRNCWDDVPVGRMLSRQTTTIPRHHVGMVGHITSVELLKTMKAVDASNGFGNRMLFLAVRRTQVLPDPGVPLEIVADLVPALKDAIDKGSKVRWLKFDQQAASLWRSFYETEARQPKMGLAGDITARHESHVVRLSLLYAMADGEDGHIRVEHLRAAIALADYARRSVVYIFGTSTGNRDADALWHLLKEVGEVGRTDAGTHLGIKTAAKLDEAIEVLVRLGVAQTGHRKRTGGHGGRGKQVIRLKAPNTPNTPYPPGGLQGNGAGISAPPTSGIGVFEHLHEDLQGPRGVWSAWSPTIQKGVRRRTRTAVAEREPAAGSVPGQLGMFDG